jgi:hypothetical protein
VNATVGCTEPSRPPFADTPPASELAFGLVRGDARTLLWLGLAAALALAGAIGAGTVIAKPYFDELHLRILGNAIAGLVCGGAALAGLRSVEEQPRSALGWIVLGIAPVAFAALTLAIWWDSGWEQHEERLGRVVLTAVALVLGALIAGALRRSLALDLRVVRVLFVAVVGLVGAAAALAVVMIWAPSVDEVVEQSTTVDRAERALVALLVAIVASFLAVPLVERALQLRRRDTVEASPAGLPRP